MVLQANKNLQLPINFISKSKLFMKHFQNNFAKHILFVAIFFLMATNFVFAQSYVNSPNDSLTKNANLEQSVVMNITQLHPTNDTLIFHFKKHFTSIPTGWDASLCVNGACYTTLLDSGIQAPAVPGDNGLMSLHCTPHNIPGTAIIRYTQFAESSLSQVDTLTWIVSAKQNGIEHLNFIQPKIYYQANQLFLENINENFSSISIFSLDGKELMKTNLSKKEIDFISTQPIFIVQLKGNGINYSQKILTNQ